MAAYIKTDVFIYLFTFIFFTFSQMAYLNLFLGIVLLVLRTNLTKCII